MALCVCISWWNSEGRGILGSDCNCVKIGSTNASCPEADHERTISLRFWAQSWAFSDLRLPYTMFKLQPDFCPNYGQDFGLCPWPFDYVIRPHWSVKSPQSLVYIGEGGRGWKLTHYMSQCWIVMKNANYFKMNLRTALSPHHSLVLPFPPPFLCPITLPPHPP
jgi:hypothetical protein